MKREQSSKMSLVTSKGEKQKEILLQGNQIIWGSGGRNLEQECAA